jgi:hypothetical protein
MLALKTQTDAADDGHEYTRMTYTNPAASLEFSFIVVRAGREGVPGDLTGSAGGRWWLVADDGRWAEISEADLDGFVVSHLRWLARGETEAQRHLLEKDILGDGGWYDLVVASARRQWHHKDGVDAYGFDDGSVVADTGNGYEAWPDVYDLLHDTGWTDDGFDEWGDGVGLFILRNNVIATHERAAVALRDITRRFPLRWSDGELTAALQERFGPMRLVVTPWSVRLVTDKSSEEIGEYDWQGRLTVAATGDPLDTGTEDDSGAPEWIEEVYSDLGLTYPRSYTLPVAVRQ